MSNIMMEGAWEPLGNTMVSVWDSIVYRFATARTQAKYGLLQAALPAFCIVSPSAHGAGVLKKRSVFEQ